MSTVESFSLRPKLLREETQLEDPPIKYWEPHEIKIKLYLKECERLKVIPIGAYIRQPTQNVLKLKYYNIGPNGAKALSVALLLDTVISYLDVEGNSITAIGLASIMEALTDNTHVTYLNIADNKLGKHGARLISNMMLHNHCVVTLDASKNGFTDSDANEFAKVIRENRVMKELILSGNEFGEHAGTEFGNALASNETLERLDLSWNHIRKRGAIDFANGVRENVGLKKLDIGFNGLGTEGAVYLGQALTTNRTLLELDISKNRITDIDIRSFFAKQLASNDTLQVLRIADNLFNALSAMELLRSVMALETSSMEVLDFGTLSVDKCFLMVLQELEERKDIKVIHGRIQEIYLDRDMMPVTENPEQDLADFDGATPSDIDKTEKGKTYVIDDKKDEQGEESKTVKPDDQEGPGGSEENNDAKNIADSNSTDDQIKAEGDKSEAKNQDEDTESVVEFDEKKLDEEIEAVTGKPPVKQRALADDKGSVGTVTPDI